MNMEVCHSRKPLSIWDIFPDLFSFTKALECCNRSLSQHRVFYSAVQDHRYHPKLEEVGARGGEVQCTHPSLSLSKVSTLPFHKPLTAYPSNPLRLRSSITGLPKKLRKGSAPKFSLPCACLLFSVYEIHFELMVTYMPTMTSTFPQVW